MEIFFFVPFFLLLIIVSFAWNSSRSQTLIENWARERGYRLLEAKTSFLGKGPFFWTTSRGQTVYRIVVEDEHGRRREGWARCGSWMWGLMSEQVEVSWDGH